MNIKNLEQLVRSGEAEVEDLLEYLNVAQEGDLDTIKELKMVAEADEKSANLEGTPRFPISKWLSIIGLYLAGGLDSLQAEFGKRKSSLPFILGICRALVDSPKLRDFLSVIARNVVGKSQRRWLILAINDIYAFRPIKLPSPDLFVIENFVKEELQSTDLFPLALCAARGFPSSEMLELVLSVPSPRGVWKDAKSTAIRSIAKDLKALRKR